MKNKLGIYVHVPFCAAKCAYCDFYSLAGKPELWDIYVYRMLADLQTKAAECQDWTIDTIYFGGGTPSLLGGKRIAKMLDTIRHAYHVQTDAEITVEANPDSMTDAFLSQTYAAGVNRLSIGIQSADDTVLQALGRVHTFSQAKDAFFRARKAGFDNISVDLMYALPGQTIGQLEQSIDAVLALQPEHISCYGLTLEPRTPLGRQHPILPDEDAQADMYLLLCEKMKQSGFEHYEISNFAKPDSYSRHNSRYWKQSPYLGFRPGAHGDWQGMRYELPRDLPAWLAGTLQPIPEDTEPIDRAVEYVMLSLRTAEGFDSAYYQTHFLRSAQPIEQILSHLPKQYIEHTSSRWHLTDSGFLISNAILVEVLEEI